MKRLLLFCAVLLTATPADAFTTGHVVAGPARAIDGDTIEIEGLSIRLVGVVAPELKEHDGQHARTAMQRILHGQNVRCSLTGEKSHSRYRATCWIGTHDLGALIIASGLARDCPRKSGGRYAALETARSITQPLPRYCRFR